MPGGGEAGPGSTGCGTSFGVSFGLISACSIAPRVGSLRRGRWLGRMLTLLNTLGLLPAHLCERASHVAFDRSGFKNPFDPVDTFARLHVGPRCFCCRRISPRRETCLPARLEATECIEWIGQSLQLV